jgi:transcriptional regulator with XRE-family HTH domain
MSVFASIWSDYKESVARQKAARNMGDRAVRLMPDFGGQSVPDTTHGDRDLDAAERVVRRGRVVVRTVEEPTVVTTWAIGQNVRAARLKAGLTQEELADRTGMARPNVARVESGRHAASIETLRRVAKALGVAVAALLAAPLAASDEDDLALAESDVAEWGDLLDGEDRA